MVTWPPGLQRYRHERISDRFSGTAPGWRSGSLSGQTNEWLAAAQSDGWHQNWETCLDDVRLHQLTDGWRWTPDHRGRKTSFGFSPGSKSRLQYPEMIFLSSSCSACFALRDVSSLDGTFLLLPAAEMCLLDKTPHYSLYLQQLAEIKADMSVSPVVPGSYGPLHSYRPGRRHAGRRSASVNQTTDSVKPSDYSNVPEPCTWNTERSNSGGMKWIQTVVINMQIHCKCCSILPAVHYWSSD